MRNILVVGATGSIGSAITKSLSTERLFTISRTRHPEVNSIHRTLDLSIAVSQPDVGAIIDSIDTLDALIWTPGLQSMSMLEDLDERELTAQFYIHLGNLMVFVKHLLPKLRQSDFGRIIVMSSVWGETGASNEVVYSSMKGGQHAFVKALAKEVALTNVTVNAIAPGVVDSDMYASLPKDDQTHLLNELPQRRLVTPEEIVHAVHYLLDKKSQSVTGEIMRINGGWYT